MKQIELSKKQCEFIKNSTHRWNGKIGATQCGKTFIDIAYVIPERIGNRRGLNGLNVILGVTKESIERNVFAPMRDFWGSTLVGEINSRNVVKIFGEKSYCLGAEKISHVSKLRGSKFKYVYCDEIVEYNQELFELLKSRLSLDYSVCDFTGNPSDPGHFIKEFIDSDADIYCQNWTLYDNPFISKRYIAELEKEYFGTVYFDRYILGLWQKADGLVYPNFDKITHVVPTVERQYTKYYISNDYGTQHACVFLLFGLYNNVWYCIKELYHKGSAGRQKTVDEYYTELLEFADGYKITQFIRDQAPIAASFNIHLQRKGDFAWRDCDNEVLAGIQDVAMSLNNGLIKINDCCVNLIREFGLYSWNKDSVTDEPIKENDDAVSALRYFVHTAKIAVAKRKGFLSESR